MIRKSWKELQQSVNRKVFSVKKNIKKNQSKNIFFSKILNLSSAYLQRKFSHASNENLVNLTRKCQSGATPEKQQQKFRVKSFLRWIFNFTSMRWKILFRNHLTELSEYRATSKWASPETLEEVV